MEMDTDEQGGRTSQGAATPSTVAPDTAKETMTESTAVEATPDAMEVLLAVLMPVQNHSAFSFSLQHLPPTDFV